MNQKEYGENLFDTYDIQFGNTSFKYYLYSSYLANYIQQLYKLENIDSYIIVSDKNIGNMYGQSIARQIRNKYKCDLLLFDFTEKNKNFKSLEELIEKVLSLKATRRTCIIGLGGGVCGNISGLAAALLFRGLKFVHIPTSLMSILDSTLSLKQAINSNFGKNIVGVFYTSEMVIANIYFLRTLPKCEIVSGMCEVIKNALAILPEDIEQLFNVLNQQCHYTPQDYHYFIDMSIRAKTLVMRNDPFEKHDALILEYGHTVGHAIELAVAGEISHGEAIGLGMLCAAEVSHLLGYLSEKEIIVHRALLDMAGASTKIPRHIDPDAILSIIKFDNKRGYVNCQNSDIQMVLLDSIGKPLRDNRNMLTLVPEEVIRKAICKLYT